MPIRAKKLAAQSGAPQSGPNFATVLEQFATWFDNRETGISALTIRGYLADLGKFAEWFQISSAEPFTPSGCYAGRRAELQIASPNSEGVQAGDDQPPAGCTTHLLYLGSG